MHHKRVSLILVGVSGAGKSTLAKLLRILLEARGVGICSADARFTDEEGNYNFNPQELPLAHQDCLRQYLAYLNNLKTGVVLVDNTSTTNWERRPYYSLAPVFDVEPWIVVIRTPPDIAAARNVHGVPEQRVFQMWERLEKPLPFWNSVELSGSESSAEQAQALIARIGLQA